MTFIKLSQHPEIALKWQQAVNGAMTPGQIKAQSESWAEAMKPCEGCHRDIEECQCKEKQMTNTEPFQDFEPDNVLHKAVGQFQRVVVVGVNMAGEHCFMASNLNPGDCLFDLEQAKKLILDGWRPSP